jgi:hypothetical protein
MLGSLSHPLTVDFAALRMVKKGSALKFPVP